MNRSDLLELDKNYIYLNYFSGLPLDNEVILTMSKYFNAFNPHIGIETKTQTIYEAKKIELHNILTKIIFGSTQNDFDLIINSGSSESISHTITEFLFLWLRNNKKNKVPIIITSDLEHKATYQTIINLSRIMEIEHITIGTPCNIYSLQQEIKDLYSIDIFKNTIDTIEFLSRIFLVSIIHLNNESGDINDIKSISNYFYNKVPINIDSTQSVGKIYLPTNINSCCVSFHKFGGPNNVGALILNNTNKNITSNFKSLIGGSHNNYKRGGTESLYLLAGALKSSEILYHYQNSNIKKVYNNMFVYFLNILTNNKIGVVPYNFVSNFINFREFQNNKLSQDETIMLHKLLDNNIVNKVSDPQIYILLYKPNIIVKDNIIYSNNLCLPNFLLFSILYIDPHSKQLEYFCKEKFLTYIYNKFNIVAGMGSACNQKDNSEFSKKLKVTHLIKSVMRITFCWRNKKKHLEILVNSIIQYYNNKI